MIQFPMESRTIVKVRMKLVEEHINALEQKMKHMQGEMEPLRLENDRLKKLEVWTGIWIKGERCGDGRDIEGDVGGK